MLIVPSFSIAGHFSQLFFISYDSYLYWASALTETHSCIWRSSIPAAFCAIVLTAQFHNALSSDPEQGPPSERCRGSLGPMSPAQAWGGPGLNLALVCWCCTEQRRVNMCSEWGSWLWWPRLALRWCFPLPASVRAGWVCYKPPLLFLQQSRSFRYGALPLDAHCVTLFDQLWPGGHIDEMTWLCSVKGIGDIEGWHLLADLQRVASYVRCLSVSGCQQRRHVAQPISSEPFHGDAAQSVDSEPFHGHAAQPMGSKPFHAGFSGTAEQKGGWSRQACN